MDPLGKYSDAYIWECIRNAKMNDYIDRMPNGLDTVIESDGLGLSNGEKQVITCIRGLLSMKKPGQDTFKKYLDTFSEKYLNIDTLPKMYLDTDTFPKRH